MELLERERCLADLIDWLGAVAERGGCIALVSGEAGIGKSRLVRELRIQLQPATTMILQGNCFETDQTLPYAAISDLLRTFFATLTPAHRNATVRASASELIRLLPELAQHFPDLPLSTGEEDQDKRRLHQALMQVFTDLSAATPLLVIIEDVHWCSVVAEASQLPHLVRPQQPHRVEAEPANRPRYRRHVLLVEPARDVVLRLAAIPANARELEALARSRGGVHWLHAGSEGSRPKGAGGDRSHPR